jgi:hypothetical protein
MRHLAGFALALLILVLSEPLLQERVMDYLILFLVVLAVFIAYNSGDPL